MNSPPLNQPAVDDDKVEPVPSRVPVPSRNDDCALGNEETDTSKIPTSSLPSNDVTTSTTDEVKEVTTTTTISSTSSTTITVAEEFSFSVDLVQRSQEHKQFLQYMHMNGYTILASITTQSLHRYKNLWLPLVVEAYRVENETKVKKDVSTPTSNEDGDITNTSTTPTTGSSVSLTEQLIPPPDVAWLWHCHRLAPARYRAYLLKEYGSTEENDSNDTRSDTSIPSILNFNDPKRPFETTVSKVTKQLWQKLYPKESFDLVLDKNILKNWKQHQLDKVPETSTSFLCDGYDLLSACERQQSFLYQISLPQYHDVTCIKDYAIPCYYKFLLMKKHPATKEFFIVPTYPIDFMWHTHILSSIPAYGKDCRTIIGMVLNHDDNIGDRSEGSPLIDSWGKTCDLWYELYGSNYRTMGGYRGEPPIQYYKQAINAMKQQQIQQRKAVQQEQQQQYKLQKRQQQHPSLQIKSTPEQGKDYTKQSVRYGLFRWFSYAPRNQSRTMNENKEHVEDIQRDKRPDLQ